MIRPLVFRIASRRILLACCLAGLTGALGLLPAPAVFGVLITQNFDSDPGWEGVGNRDGNQNFGFSNTNFAGGAAGEAGGVIIRESLAYYADDVGSLDPSTEVLTVSGVGVLQNPSSGNVLVGWFDKDSALNWPPAHFLGFRSDEDDLYLYAGGGGDQLAQNLAPGQPFSFTVTYDPSANGGNGAVVGSVNGGASVTRNLGGGDKDNINDLDRFGLLNLFISGSGNTTEVYFDNLQYTSAIPEPGTWTLLVGAAVVLLAKGRKGRHCSHHRSA